MFTVVKITTFLAVFLLLTQFLPEVTSLPFGLDYALTFFVGTIHGILKVMPFLITTWNLILAALAIEVALFTWERVKWFLELASHLL